MSESHPLIISGAPRSGTSLLYNLFDGHPEVNWLVDEGFLFEYLDDIGAGSVEVFLDAVPDDVDTLVDGLRDKQVIPPLHLPYLQSVKRGSVSEVAIDAPWDEDAFRAVLARPREPGVAGLWRWLVAACLAGMGESPKTFACMKSPDYGKSASRCAQQHRGLPGNRHIPRSALRHRQPQALAGIARREAPDLAADRPEHSRLPADARAGSRRQPKPPAARPLREPGRRSKAGHVGSRRLARYRLRSLSSRTDDAGPPLARHFELQANRRDREWPGGAANPGADGVGARPHPAASVGISYDVRL